MGRRKIEYDPNEELKFSDYEPDSDFEDDYNLLSTLTQGGEEDE